MLDYTKEDLLELGAEITTREIYQQPDVGKKLLKLIKHDVMKLQPSYKELLTNMTTSRLS